MEEFSFNVDGDIKGEWISYRQFIEMVRGKMVNTYSHNRPVLLPEQKDNIRLFQVALQSEGRNVGLRIRRDNLYLEAYRPTPNSDRWLQFGSGDPQANFLGFGGGYNDLKVAAKRGRENIRLGQLQLKTAVNQLASTTSREERAKELTVVIQMICEAIRFSRILDHLARNHTPGDAPPAWMVKLENGWGQLSEALLRADSDPTTRFFPLPQPNDMQIVTAEQAVAALGILKFFDFRKPRILAGNAVLQQGRVMAEVFWVRIDNVGGQIHGTITVADGLGSQNMYDRQKASPETISPGGKILLTGPNRAISAADSFTVNLALWNKATPSRDDEVSNGTVAWNVFDTANNVFDRILYGDVKGAHGSARVCYMLLSEAVEATISVELVNAGGKNPAKVYGEIAATYSNYPSGEPALLFAKKREENISLRPGQPIGLARKTVAVPTNYSLSVRAELYDHDTTSPAREIANGVAVFPPLFDGESQKNITGRNGNILVKVTWNPSWRA